MLSTPDAVERIAAVAPTRAALVTGTAQISFGELAQRVGELAATLRATGARVLALLADNSIEWIVADLAAQRANIALVPLPGFFSEAQRRHALIDSGAELVIFDHHAQGIAEALELGTCAALGEQLTLLRLERALEPSALPSHTAKVSYTSGTTAAPKGVCLAQAAMDCVADSLRQATQQLDLRRHLCALPLALLLENVAGVFAPLRNGTEVCVPSLNEIGWRGTGGLDVARLLQAVDRYQPDSVILVPQMLHDLVAHLEHAKRDAPASLRFVAVGGGHVAPALLARAAAVGLPVFEGYGLTESASVVALNSPEARRSGSVGRPLAHARVRISKRGEILVSGATHLGYAGRPEETSDEIATGDLGHIDGDGYLHVGGRVKNVFITSFGRNVSPEWLEAELVNEPAIAQAAVFGEARPWSVAVLAIAPGATPAMVDAAVSHVNARLPHYACIGDWLLADEAFSPANGLATANGRNRRDALWRRYRDRIETCYDLYVPQPIPIQEVS